MNNELTLIEYFQKTIELFGHSVDKGQTYIDAIKNIDDYAHKNLHAVNVINYFFADHGYDHSHRMASLLYQYFTCLKEKQKLPKELLDDKEFCHSFFLILWTALLLHDIGMTRIESSDKKKPTKKLWVSQSSRKEHVKKSYEMIMAFHNESCFMNWNSYWSNKQEPVLVWNIVSRMVKSHGDSDEEWLDSSYLYVGQEGEDLFEYFGDKKEKYQKILQWGSAFLCCADLADICESRILFLQNEDLAPRINELGHEELTATKEHWISNYAAITDFKWKNDKVFLQITFKPELQPPGRYFNYMVLYYLLKHSNSNAIKTVKNWGDREVLKSILSPFNYGGVSINVASVSGDNSIWEEMEKLNKKYFEPNKDEKRTDLQNLIWNNCKLSNNCPSLMYQHIVKYIYKYINDNELNEIQNLLITFIRYEIPLEHIVQIEGNVNHNNGENIFVFDSQESKTVEFLGALNLAERLLGNCIKKQIKEGLPDEYMPSIFWAKKGNEYYNNLMSKDTKILKNNIYIMEIEQYKDSISGFIDKLYEEKTAARIILVSKDQRPLKFKEEQKHLVKKLKIGQILEFDAIIPLFAVLCKTIYKYRGVDDFLPEKSSNFDAYILALRKFYDGSRLIEQKIINDYNNGNISPLIYLNIVSLFSINNKANGGRQYVERNLVSENYNEFLQIIIPRVKKLFFYNQEIKSISYNQSDIESSYKDILEIEDKLLYIYSKNGFDLGKVMLECNNNISQNKNYLPANIANEFMQIMLILWIHHLESINVNSLLFQEYIAIIPINVISSFILGIDSNSSSIEKRSGVAICAIKTALKNLQSHRNFLIGFLSKLLSKVADIDNDEGMIVFQVIYRLWEELISYFGDEKNNDINDYKSFIDCLETKFSNYNIYKLGQFEAICSMGDIDDAFGKDKLEEGAKFFIESYRKNNTYQFVKFAFDIIKNYTTKKKASTEIYEMLLQINKYFTENIPVVSEWEKICLCFHSDVEYSKIDSVDQNSDLFKEWAEMRTRFLKIVESIPPGINPRNKP